MSVVKVNSLIDSNPDLKTRSKHIRLLKGGEVISQSDFLHQYPNWNAVKLFDKRLHTFWHSQRQGARNKNNEGDESYPYLTHPYMPTNTYTSIYQGGGSPQTIHSTPILNGASIAGSWAQITFPETAYPTEMSIQVRKNNYNVVSQREIPKKISLVVSNDDQNIADEQKTWTHLATYDFGTEYATKIEFNFKGVFGTEYFTIEINGKIYSSYVASKTESNEIIYIAGLDTLKITFLNQKSFSSAPSAPKASILFSRFTVNGKEMRDFFKHDTRRSRLTPKQGAFTHQGGYDLVAAFPGDANKPMYKPIKLSSSNHKYDVGNSGCRSIRMIVEELYGGEKFNIATWYIGGNIGTQSGINEGFSITNANAFTNRDEIQKTLFNGIYTNAPEISGIQLSNIIEPRNKEGFETEDSPMALEKEIIELINKFNDEYYNYVHCNGLHLKDSERNRTKCIPENDYYRKLAKISFNFKMGPNSTDGSNGIQYMRFMNGDTVVGRPFVSQFTAVPFAKNTTHSIVIENVEDSNGNIIDQLQGLGDYHGEITHLVIGIQNTKFVPSTFVVKFTDQRGHVHTFINATKGDFVTDDNQAAPKDTALTVTGNTIKYYNNGLNKLNTVIANLDTKLESLSNATVTDGKGLAQYKTDANVLSSQIKGFLQTRYEMDMKLRELYKLKGTTSASKELEYNGAMMSGMLWTALTATVLYYTFYEFD